MEHGDRGPLVGLQVALVPEHLQVIPDRSIENRSRSGLSERISAQGVNHLVKALGTLLKPLIALERRGLLAVELRFQFKSDY